MLTPGVRVVRGPDWSWANQDGGEGYVGTLCEIGKACGVGSPDKTVVVQWDNGVRTNYRVGYLGKYDLRVIDNAQIGVRHPNIVCDNCNVQGISGMRYKCAVCYDFDLCYTCYHGGLHDLHHAFKRCDSAQSSEVDLPPRLNARRCELKGIFVGALVVRGYNWEWDNQDGGDGKVGRVRDIRGWDNESYRSVANVAWFTGTTNVYRLGHKSNCDLKCIEFASGGFYYPDHLPVLGKQMEQMLPQPTKPGPPSFVVGDKVKVIVTEEQLKQSQQGHGGWNPRMAEYVGKVGIVHRVTDKGDIRVQYEGCNNRWTFNPATLSRVTSIAVGDIVSVITDIKRVRELQRGHGEWIEIMKDCLGKLGKVLKVYNDGDLRVQLDGQAWTLNPQCVRLLPGSATELANTMTASQNQRKEPSIQWSPPAALPNLEGTLQQSDICGPGSQLVRVAAQGHLDFVRRILEAAPALVDSRGGGKTALQVAAHQGHVAVVNLLLTAGASVNTADIDGDTCLHYAAFGNQPAILETLVKKGANLNAANKSGCTALHVAAHKSPALCVRVLLDAGADPNCRDHYGDTPLHDAIGKDVQQAVEMLCSAPGQVTGTGIDFTLRNNRGFNVLHHAALKGKAPATHTLLRHARQLIDVKKDDGFSALHLAALNGHREVVEVLLTIGQADIDLQNNRKQTALLLAVSQGHCAVIELLVRSKANINTKDEDGDTALHLVLMKRGHLGGAGPIPEESPEISSIYEEIGVTVEHRLAVAIACYLVRRGLAVDTPNSKGVQPLELLQDTEASDLIGNYRQPLPIELSSDLAAPVDILVQRMTLNDYNLTDNPGQQDLPGTSDTNEEVEDDDEPDPDGEVREGVSRPVECLVCSELSEENVRLEPCGHRPACEDCCMRMKKCLHCGRAVQRRITKDGRLIPARSRQPSAERMRYLESKIAEIEESHACSICMERRRNVVFLCGHGACGRCAETLRTCHMCRKTITKKIPVY